MRDGNEQLLYAATSDSSGSWHSPSATLQVALPANMLPGIWRAQIVTNAIPSMSVALQITAPITPAVPAMAGWTAVLLAAGLALLGLRAAAIRRRAGLRSGR
jgi:hypothetical protein